MKLAPVRVISFQLFWYTHGFEIHQQYFFFHYVKQLIKPYLSYIGSWISFSKPASYIGFSLSFTELSLK